MRAEFPVLARTAYLNAGTDGPLSAAAASASASELERELQENVWLTCDPDEDLLFGPDHEAKWSKALAKIGVAAGQLSHLAGRA